MRACADDELGKAAGGIWTEGRANPIDWAIRTLLGTFGPTLKGPGCCRYTSLAGRIPGRAALAPVVGRTLQQQRLRRTSSCSHISPASPEGPRYDPTQTEPERHAFDNLMLASGPATGDRHADARQPRAEQRPGACA
jgi:hypothetical protein